MINLAIGFAIGLVVIPIALVVWTLWPDGPDDQPPGYMD